MTSPLESTSREIGGVTYEVTPLTADIGSELMVMLAKHFLPAVTEAIGSIVAATPVAAPEPTGDDANAEKASGTVARVGVVHVIGAIEKVAKTLSVDEFKIARDCFAKVTRVHLSNGSSPFLKDVYKTHFAAKYAEMLAWMAFCLEVNYGPFFEGLLPSKAQKPENAASAPSPKTSG